MNNYEIPEMPGRNGPRGAGRTGRIKTEGFAPEPELIGDGRTARTGETDPDEERDEEERRRHRRRREALRRRRERQVRRQKRLAVIAAVLIVLFCVFGMRTMMSAYAKGRISKNVLRYKDTLKKYAKREKVTKYVDTLLAIMMVESEGRGADVMQSSESKGLPRNSLGTEESIEQACIYYAALVRIAKDIGVKDEDALIQAYNYGPGYLEYVKKNGGRHSQNLAYAYAQERSGGVRMRYLHLYAIRKNGGWIYRFGNMFYVPLVKRYM